MSGHGLAWSLIAAGVLMVASIPVLATTVSSKVQLQLADRAILGGVIGLVVARGFAITMGGTGFSGMGTDIGGDVEFWFVATITTVCAGWSRGPGRRNKQVDRAAALAPCALVGYAVWAILCPIRRHCVRGSTTWGVTLDLGVGVALIAASVLLRMAWTVTGVDRFAASILALAGSRTILLLLDEDRSANSSTASIVVAVVAAVFVMRAAARAARTGAHRRRFTANGSGNVDV